MSTPEQPRAYPPHDERPHPWGSGRDLALLAWFIGIGVVAFTLGTVNGSPGHDIPTATWAAEAALVGIVAGLLLGLLTPRPPWQARGRVFVLVGAGVYALAYEIALARYWEGDNSGGAGLVFVVIAITCLVPLGAGAVIGHGLRAGARRPADEHDEPQSPKASTSEQPPREEPPFWPPPPGWTSPPSEGDDREPAAHGGSR